MSYQPVSPLTEDMRTLPSPPYPTYRFSFFPRSEEVHPPCKTQNQVPGAVSDVHTAQIAIPFSLALTFDPLTTEVPNERSGYSAISGPRFSPTATTCRVFLFDVHIKYFDLTSSYPSALTLPNQKKGLPSNIKDISINDASPYSKPPLSHESSLDRDEAGCAETEKRCRACYSEIAMSTKRLFRFKYMNEGLMNRFLPLFSTTSPRNTIDTQTVDCPLGRSRKYPALLLDKPEYRPRHIVNVV
ncbi:hypothetical protein PM082_001835 [Marasmius tenuissimus]|nr:hypothetical protein PM082_001835 [Marasmius tenuissimus]